LAYLEAKTYLEAKDVDHQTLPNAVQIATISVAARVRVSDVAAEA
jgi:hypothetical protein